MHRLPALFALALAVCSFSPEAYAQVSAYAPVMLTQSINDKVLITLPGNIRPEIKTAKDEGPVPDNFELEHMFLQLKRSPELQQALSSFLDQVQDPSSSSFHKWITAQEYGERFGLAKSDLDAVTGWLHSQGFTVNLVYPNLVVDFSGTAKEVEAAFHTQLHELVVNGARHFGNTTNPQIPAALGPLVAGISALHDFMPHSLAHSFPGSNRSETGIYVRLPGTWRLSHRISKRFIT